MFTKTTLVCGTACVLAAVSPLTLSAPIEDFENIFKSQEVDKTLDAYEDTYGLNAIAALSEISSNTFQLVLTSGNASVVIYITQDGKHQVTIDAQGVTQSDGSVASPSLPLENYELALKSNLVRAELAELKANYGLTNITLIAPFGPPGEGPYLPGHLYIFFPATALTDGTFRGALVDIAFGERRFRSKVTSVTSKLIG